MSATSTARPFKPRIAGGWYELPLGVEVRLARRMGSEEIHIYERRLSGTERLVAIVEQHPMGAEARRGWHISVSHQVLGSDGQGKPGRNPTWEEIKDARYRFTPSDVEMCMILPRPGDFVNVHQTCFHLHQHFERGE